MKTNLSTRWLGLELEHPLVASSGPLTGNLDSLKRLEDAGIAAVVLPSIFEERLASEASSTSTSTGVADSTGSLLRDERTCARQLELVRSAKSALGIPVIASLNGHTLRGWSSYAREVEEAGADALELNIYSVPADLRRSGLEVERDTIDLARAVRRATRLPLAIKISPFYSSPGHMALQLDEVGADGLVLFNRFLQPDIDLDELRIEPRVDLSHSEESRLALRWIALLRGQLGADLAATSGVHQISDVAKLLLAGADVTMMTSALLVYGPSHVARLRVELKEWLEAHDYAAMSDIKGKLSQARCLDPDAFERAQYVAALSHRVWRA